ncbi:diguanylate cyclase [Rhizobium sp. RU33A]|uniref:GGDEF domain-containing protein n=1 Tax=Rhizobium sp. RU33A TaxID=1907413 RepID=UPI00097118E5|nr:diguanylate cyclase [Rhizobium sp. RU33A]
MRKLTLPMVGVDNEADPPWEHLSTLFHIFPHIVAAIAILSAAILPYMEGRTVEVLIVMAILSLQVIMRGVADFRFRRRGATDTAQQWLKRFTLVSVLSGVAWGASLAILYSGGSPDAQVVILAVGCGILQSSAARAYMAPRSTLLVIVVMTASVNLVAVREGNWIMVPICLAYVGFLASYMIRLIAMDERRLAAETKTRTLVAALAESNEKLTDANEQLRRHAETDALTGLGNRRGFDAQLSHRLGRYRNDREPLALLLIDIDHFKLFNDTHGHQAGDAALQVVAEVIAACMRDVDGTAARYGGEEFAMVLQGNRALQPAVFAEDLRKRVASVFLPTADGGSANLTVSIGVAKAGPEDDERSLIALADRRLYAAKGLGRDRVCDTDHAKRLVSSA